MPASLSSMTIKALYSGGRGGRLKLLRLEFIIPTTKSYLKQGAAGNTSVVFATEGDVNVNVGFNNPNNYSTANPLLVTPCYIVGDYNDPYGSNQDVLVGLFYDWGTAPTNADKDDEVPFTSIHYARNIEIGTTWGTAWDRTTNTIYLAAYHKKHTNYGPN